MTIVADTGPLIGLAKLGMLDALRLLAAEVIIAPAIHRELLAKVGSESEALDQALRDFIQVRPPRLLEPAAEDALRPLDEGERQAIRLAGTMGQDVLDVLLVIDDRAGREAAARLGVSVTGLVGVLLRLKEQGHVTLVAPLVETLRERGYWLSDDIVAAARRLAGEA